MKNKRGVKITRVKSGCIIIFSLLLLAILACSFCMATFDNRQSNIVNGTTNYQPQTTNSLSLTGRQIEEPPETPPDETPPDEIPPEGCDSCVCDPNCIPTNPGCGACDPGCWCRHRGNQYYCDCRPCICPEGFSCINSNCQPESGCATDQGCPSCGKCAVAQCFSDATCHCIPTSSSGCNGGQSCSKNSDCGSGLLCYNGECKLPTGCKNNKDETKECGPKLDSNGKVDGSCGTCTSKDKPYCNSDGKCVSESDLNGCPEDNCNTVKDAQCNGCNKIKKCVEKECPSDSTKKYKDWKEEDCTCGMHCEYNQEKNKAECVSNEDNNGEFFEKCYEDSEVYNYDFKCKDSQEPSNTCNSQGQFPNSEDNDDSEIPEEEGTYVLDKGEFGLTFTAEKGDWELTTTRLKQPDVKEKLKQGESKTITVREGEGPARLKAISQSEKSCGIGKIIAAQICTHMKGEDDTPPKTGTTQSSFTTTVVRLPDQTYPEFQREYMDDISSDKNIFKWDYSGGRAKSALKQFLGVIYDFAKTKKKGFLTDGQMAAFQLWTSGPSVGKYFSLSPQAHFIDDIKCIDAPASSCLSKLFRGVDSMKLVKFSFGIVITTPNTYVIFKQKKDGYISGRNFQYFMDRMFGKYLNGIDYALSKMGVTRFARICGYNYFEGDSNWYIYGIRARDPLKSQFDTRWLVDSERVAEDVEEMVAFRDSIMGIGEISIEMIGIIKSGGVIIPGIVIDRLLHERYLEAAMTTPFIPGLPVGISRVVPIKAVRGAVPAIVKGAQKISALYNLYLHPKDPAAALFAVATVSEGTNMGNSVLGFAKKACLLPKNFGRLVTLGGRQFTTVNNNRGISLWGISDWVERHLPEGVSKLPKNIIKEPILSPDGKRYLTRAEVEKFSVDSYNKILADLRRNPCQDILESDIIIEAGVKRKTRWAFGPPLSSNPSPFKELLGGDNFHSFWITL